MNISEISEQATNYSLAETILCLAGLVLLIKWLIKTSWGTKALTDSLPRRNNMPLYLPFIAILTWFSSVSLGMLAHQRFLPDLPEWQAAFLDNTLLCLCSIAVMALILLFAKMHFIRGLKGFGLDLKTLHKDFLVSPVNLITVWPLMTIAFLATIFFGQLILGENFQISQHQELTMMTDYSQFSLRLLIIVTTIVIVPAFEEMLFRGLFQSVIRSHIVNPWPSIIMSSAIFTMVHQDIAHWPTLFTLAMCLGYSYEKSGSLFRPIFIHSTFNAISVLSTLLLAQ